LHDKLDGVQRDCSNNQYLVNALQFLNDCRYLHKQGMITNVYGDTHVHMM